MPISTTDNRIVYQGNGSSASFNFPYRFVRNTDIAVFTYNSSASTDGLISFKTINVNYAVSGFQNNQGIFISGANFVFNSAPNPQTQIVLFRSSVVTNDFVVGQNGAIPSTSLNNEIDYLTMLAQRAQDLNTRSVRLPDGFPGSFDPSLPANINQSAGKRLIVNSGAWGWTFDETTASYIPNTVAVATTNSTITSLGGAPDGRVLVSRGSSLPEWTTVNFASSASIVGITPIANGGTNNIGFLPNTVMYYDQASSRIASVENIIAGSVLTTNASSWPTFQTFSGANINSGIISVFNGGTGTNEQFPPQSVVFVGSGGQYVSHTGIQFNSGTLGFQLSALAAAPVRSSASGVLESGSTSLTAEVSGVLPYGNGGTGQTSYLSGGVVYASGATQFGSVQVGSTGHALLSNGPAVRPSFGPIAVSNTVRTIVTTDTATTSDRVIRGNAGTSYFVANLYTAVGNDGRELRYVKVNPTVGTSVLNSFEVKCAAGEYIQNGDTIGSSFYMSAKGEVADFQSDGIGWQVMGHSIPGGPTLYMKDVNGTGGGGTAAVGSSLYRSLASLSGNTSFGRLTGSSGIFILQPGIYSIWASAQFYRVGEARLKLQNLNDASPVIIGVTTFCANATADNDSATTLMGTFVINTSKTMAVQYGTTGGQVTDGLGHGVNWNDSTVHYFHVAITKIG